MKVSINKGVLETILINTQPYLEKKDLSQITSHILINTIEDELILKATDFEIGLSYNSKNVKIIDHGTATANGKKLLDIIKILKDDEVILETINDNLYIKQNSSKFNINSSLFVRSIKKIAPAIDNNNPKFELNGALIDIKNDFINLVSTDTRRLAIVKLENSTGNTFSLIIPKKAIGEIQKLFFDEIEIYYDENTLIAKSSNFQFFTKLINGKFPDYERIIPKEKKYRLLLNRSKIVEAVKQISIISNEMKITFKSNKIVFESLNDENIEAKTEIEYTTGLDEDIYLATNSRYLIDFLSNIENSDFTLGFNDSSLPFTLEDENFITIVMPIMI